MSFTGIYDDSRDGPHLQRQNARKDLCSWGRKADEGQHHSVPPRIPGHVSVDQNSLQISPALIPILSQPEQLHYRLQSRFRARSPRRPERCAPRESTTLWIRHLPPTFFRVEDHVSSRALGRETPPITRLTRDLIPGQGPTKLRRGENENWAGWMCLLPERFLCGRHIFAPRLSDKTKRGRAI